MIGPICEAWEQAAAVEHVDVVVRCRSAITIDEPGDQPRFAYVSVASPIEQVLGESANVVDRGGDTLSVAELSSRLVEGEVAAVVAPARPVSPPSAHEVPVVLGSEHVERRNLVRQQHVLARFLIRQIGLEEVSSHRGAPSQLYSNLAALWSHDLALCIDPAMLLTLGADRQRYVDANFNDRATDRLPRALGRLHDLGVRSYPRLVIV